MDQKTIVLCIAGGAVALVLLGLAWSRLRAWLTARELRHAYQPRPLFSAHERAAYKVLREMTDELGLVLFVKVRLLDLAEPRPHHRKYQLYLNKVSAKHVDFVVCSAKSEPRLVIELDDFTHDTPSRQARDEFVDTVLESCGYGVVHTRNVDRDCGQGKGHTAMRRERNCAADWHSPSSTSLDAVSSFSLMNATQPLTSPSVMTGTAVTRR